MCGQVDRLEAWSEAARARTLAEAARRRESVAESTSDRSQYNESPQAAARSLSRPPRLREDV